jgi:hypothetical protein
MINKIINIKALCECETPFHYNRWKPEKNINGLNEDAVKLFLLDPDPLSKEGVFKSRVKYISKDNYPNIGKTESSAPNKRYIDFQKAGFEEKGFIGLTGKEFGRVSTIGNTVKKTVNVLNKIFAVGEVLKTVSVFYNIEKNIFLTAKPKKINPKIIECTFEVDFINFNPKTKTGFVVIIVFEKSVNPQNIIYQLAKKGIDVYSSFLLDALKTILGAVNLDLYILGVETGNFGNSGVLMKWENFSLEIGRDSYIKRLQTLAVSIETNVFDSYDFNSFETEAKGVVKIQKIGLNPNTIKLRESNKFW